MSETDPLAAHEAELGHTFEMLTTRILGSFSVLDVMAHTDGSEHRELEVLNVMQTINGIPSVVHIKKRPSGVVTAKTIDSEGINHLHYRCDLSQVIPQDEPMQGKHVKQPLTQQDQMIVIASLLEGCVHAISEGKGTVNAYGA